MSTSRPLRQRFWRHVSKSSEDQCWEWKGTRNRSGYGQIPADRYREPGNSKVILAHRASWQIHFGVIPDGMKVLHKCDNPPCVNPNHLFLGTPQDNTQDMIKKGRAHFQKLRLSGDFVPHLSVPISLDDNTRELLDRIAEYYSNGKKPNRSREVCRLIRETAIEMGFVKKNLGEVTVKSNGR